MIIKVGNQPKRMAMQLAGIRFLSFAKEHRHGQAEPFEQQKPRA